MRSYAEFISTDLRLMLLESLEQAAGYSMNVGSLVSFLAATGARVSQDRVRTELAWLAEQGLVTVENVLGYEVAMLTARGADVAAGYALVPGVKRPGPGE